MHPQQYFLILFSTALVNASPFNIHHEARQNFDPFNPCKACFRSTWTAGPECTTNSIIQSTISRILNPPASETSTYTPTKWCTDYLHQTDWSTSYTTSSGISTYTNWTITHLFVTKTDLDHPTSTMYCPSPSSGMECGWDSNTIAPLDQGEDWTIEHYYNPEECQQVCLEHGACKAYRVDGSAEKGWSCEIFNVGLGKNASNVRNPTPNGSQWWDRNCQQHIPTPCRSNGARTVPWGIVTNTPTAVLTTDAAGPTLQPNSIVPIVPPQYKTTSAPTALPRADIAKRDAPLPPYMSDLNYFWSNIYVTPACSCLISSALAPVESTTTRTVTSWTSSTTVYSTHEDWFAVTTTPRETTIYVSTV